MRVLLILAALAAITGCVASNDEAGRSQGDTAVPATTQELPVASPPAEPRRTSFLLDGIARQGGLIIGRAPSDTRTLLFNGAALSPSADGYFLIGFDRDAPASAVLKAVLADGASVIEPLSVAPGAWRIEHIDAARTGGAKSTADFERKRAGELAQINAARRVHSDSQGWRQRFLWPVKGRMSGYFGSQRIYRGAPGSYHSGTDIAAPAGTPFIAPADGVVILAAEQPFTLEGRLLMIDHGNGLSSAFLHNSRLDVKTGDRVRQGQILGAVGATGRATGPHMHWGMKWGASRIDPSLLAGSM